MIKNWLTDYIEKQHQALDSVPVDEIARLVEVVRGAYQRDARIFAIGNGGSAANASHFATDLGKSASDALPKRFRVISLTDNVPWITALGNDYDYADIFVGQLQNYAISGDVLITASVSGSSPNLVNAFEWAKEAKLETVALVGGKQGKLADLADHVLTVSDLHYGRVEDVQMHVFHMLCYAFVEVDGLATGVKSD
jgi:D-sedoheptulose 7-phosphate isomerase